MAIPAISKETLRAQVAAWLDLRLKAIFPSWRIEVFDTARVTLSRFIMDHRLDEKFDCFEGFDMHADVTGLLRLGKRSELALAFCHLQPITLREVGPATLCCRLSLPRLAVFISPAGMSRSLSLLLSAYNRVDLLEYAAGQRIKIATWDIGRKQVDPNCVFPAGDLG